MSIHEHAPWGFLVVCGDTRLRETLTTAIHRFGGFANCTADSVAALAYISRRKLDGILIDMRVEGALKLVGSVRRGSSNRYCAIFACTADVDEVSRVLNAGANFIVQRKLEADKVVRVLEGAVQVMLLERHRYARYELAIPVTLNAAGNEQKAVTANISRGGMAVRCSHSLEPGRAIHFVLDLPGHEPIQGEGEVAWAKTDGNIGVRFYLLGNDFKQAIWNWIDEYAAHPPA